MYQDSERGLVEREWAEAIEGLGVSAKLWDQVIATDFALPAGKTLPDAFMRLMRDWVQDGGERYDYVRVYGMSDRNYVYYLLAQAYMDITEFETEEPDLMWTLEDAVEHQHFQAIVAFIDHNLSGPAN